MEKPIVIHPSPLQRGDVNFQELESTMFPQKTIEKAIDFTLGYISGVSFFVDHKRFDAEILTEVENANE